jgi:hypothetical protein
VIDSKSVATIQRKRFQLYKRRKVNIDSKSAAKVKRNLKVVMLFMFVHWWTIHTIKPTNATMLKLHFLHILFHNSDIFWSLLSILREILNFYECISLPVGIDSLNVMQVRAIINSSYRKTNKCTSVKITLLKQFVVTQTWFEPSWSASS